MAPSLHRTNYKWKIWLALADTNEGGVEIIDVFGSPPRNGASAAEDASPLEDNKALIWD